MPSRVNEVLSDLGFWYLLTGILGFLAWPALIISPIWMEMMVGLFIGITAVLGIIAFVTYLIALLKTRELKEMTGEDMLSLGPSLAIIGIFFVIIMLIVLVVFFITFLFYVSGPSISMNALIQAPPPGEPTTTTIIIIPMIIFMGLGGVGAILVLIGLILTAIGFWKFGEMNKSSIIQIGGILMIFLFNIGALILGLGLREIASKGRSALANETLLNTVKDYLDKQAPRGVSIDLRDVGSQYNIPGVLMIQLVKYWIMTGELQGTLSGYYYIPPPQRQEG